MRELTKEEKRAAKELLRKGILHRHAQWHQELRDFLNEPYGESGNEYVCSMEITDRARKFYKEAMMMEDYYSPNNIEMGLTCLYRDGHLSDMDIAGLSEGLQQTIRLMLRL